MENKKGLTKEQLKQVRDYVFKKNILIEEKDIILEYKMNGEIISVKTK